MTIERKDRVKDQTITTGTGTLTIDGVAPAGYRTITSAHTTGATLRFVVSNAVLSEWEVVEGVWTAAGATLTRVTVFASSNAGALVNFSAGTKTIVIGPVAADVSYEGSTAVPTLGWYSPSTGLIRTPNAVTVDGSLIVSNIAALTTPAESWVGPSSTTGIYFKGGLVGIGDTTPEVKLTIIGPGGMEAPTLGIASGAFGMLGNTGLYGLYAGVSPTTGTTWLQSMRNDGATAFAIGLNPSDGNVGIGTMTPIAQLAIGKSNGQEVGISNLTELTTIAAAATTDTAIQIPANAIVLGVSVRVTTLIPTAATFIVTGATTGTAFQTGASVLVAAGTTDVGTKACPYLNTTAQAIRITPNLTPGDTTGRVRVTIHYIHVTVPTS